MIRKLMNKVKPKNTRKKKKPSKLPGKNQPRLFQGAANPKDIMAPSLVKEMKPGEQSVEGVCTDYWVETGGTIEPIRYFRSFFAALTGNATMAGMMDKLYLGEFGEGDVDTAIHVRPADSQRTMHELGREIAGIESDLLTETNTTKKGTLMTTLRGLLQQQDRLRLEIERLFFVSIQATASGTELKSFKRFCNTMVKSFAIKGIFFRGADTRQLEALLAMTPLDKEGAFKDTFRDMESSSVADLFPLKGSFSHKTGIVIGENLQKKPILYNGREKALGTGHICVVGRTSFGKTFGILMLISRSALPPTNIRSFVIEPSMQFKKGIEGLGCPYINFANNSKYRFNIFDVVEYEAEDGSRAVNLPETVSAVQAFIHKLIKIVDPRPEVLSGIVKTRIQECIWKLYKDGGINSNPDSLYGKAQNTDSTFTLKKAKKAMPTLSDLHTEMEKVPELKNIAELVKPYTRKGDNPHQYIFDCESNVDFTKYPIYGVSLAGLDKEVMLPLAYFIVQKCAWERFGMASKDPTYIVLDEIQIPLEADEELGKWVENGYRTGRHLNIWMVSITQGFEVLLRNKYGLGIIKNSPTKIFLRQDSVDIDAIQGQFNLSTGEASFLLRSKKGYGVIKADTQSSIIYFQATKKEVELFGDDPNQAFWGDS